jgi:GT2 family glycosyltransferase
LCEGEQDYDFAAHARQFMATMTGVQRRGLALGSVFMVHRRVFDRVGGFDDDPRLGGYEDDEFFRRASRAGFRLAVTGRAFLHHFGSVTQQAIKTSRNQPAGSLGDRRYYQQKYGLTWFKRRRARLYKQIRRTVWRVRERSRYGYTLISRRENGTFIWR